MPMLINYSLTNAAPPRDFECDKEKDAAEVSGARRQIVEVFKGLHAIQARSTLHPLKRERDSSSTAQRSRSRNVITGALNLFEVHCEVRRDAAEVLMAMQDPIHLHREACLVSTLSAKESKEEEEEEEEKAKEEVRNEVDQDPPHIASKSLASELISLVLGHVDVDVTTNERER
ncbi:hypothetical protein ALC56_04402 [Trachymyrmex septentrionalis]|uniref:Uncharacterized protein n=1 Tax=Trachymyrmex septentrionalis TaxID=34720 RepID=A0A195FLP1_9HYME|nr:hypothetical protein ALC56_04402 [Trachymyrmex septentrionalis]